jgi:DUF971 family protein
MSIIPTKIERKSDDLLLIEWNDGQSHELRVADLRDRCPCATCREKRTESEKQQASSMELLPVITHAETLPPRILGMKPVGNYAYNIHFGDGHDTGIFTFDFLRQLGGETAAQE